MLRRKLHSDKIKPALAGFEGISRYWDTLHDMPAAKILPGEYYVTNNDEAITTVLGSCVSACVRDKFFGIGGMNHFMLPEGTENGWAGNGDIVSTATRYGNYAMEHMINDILNNGGHRKNLEIKIFGGGKIIDQMTNIGDRNIHFVHEYIDAELLKLTGEDVGGIYPRKVFFMPKTGKVRVKKLKHLHNDTVVKRETQYSQEIASTNIEGSVELF